MLISDITVRAVPEPVVPTQIQKIHKSSGVVRQDIMLVSAGSKLPQKARQTKSVVLNRTGLRPGLNKKTADLSPPPQVLVEPTGPSGARGFKAGGIKKASISRLMKLSSVKPVLANLKKNKRLVRSSKLNVIYIMAFLTFAGGLGVTWQTMQTNDQAKAQVQGLATSTHSDTGPKQPFTLGEDEAPDETPVDSGTVSRYAVAPNLPRYIKIDKLGEMARVRSLGILQSGALDSPKSIFDAGWYNGSSRPGDPGGAALIVGHVSGFIKPAVFANLSTLEKGDVIQIERGDGLIVKYAVDYKEAVDRDKVDMAKALVSADRRAAGLNIITCHGKYDKVAKTYAQRLVVYATQI